MTQTDVRFNFFIREAHDSDWDDIWPIFHEIVSAGETYAYDPATGKEDGFELWLKKPFKTYVVEQNGVIVGTYFLTPNQPGLGAHVCNCGYMVAEQARGQGLASAMCRHSQREAVRFGFKAMQFNLVVASNKEAVRLWRKHGFKTVGTLHKAFNHHDLGLVDAYVMTKWLDE